MRTHWKIVAVPGERDALIPILLKGTSDLAGCLSCVIADGPSQPDTIWIRR